MNFKRAFLAAVAVLMVPGYAMAQSAVTFPTSISPVEAGTPDLTLTCNGGLPLSQTAPVGTTFTVTEISVGAVCDITIGDLNAGYETATDCTGITMVDGTSAYPCDIVATASPADFYVTVDWDISGAADPDVGSGTMVEISCTTTSTTYSAAPGVAIPAPAVADVAVGDSCTAMLTGYDSAVAVDPASCTQTATVNGGDLTCAFTATAFYEGIPTLSQYGMAIMALLMLGVGFVGFRRFV